MDRKPPTSPEVLKLLELADLSRSMLGDEAERLRQRLDVPARLRDSLKHHPSSWMFGSLAAGLAASLAFRRKPRVDRKRKGFPSVLLGLTLTAARPLAKVWLANQAKSWLTGNPVSHLRGTTSPNPNSFQDSHVQPSGPRPR
jgi:hypothetical protein